MSKIRRWRFWYLVFSLCYIVWLVYLGRHDFSKIHDDYRRALYQLNQEELEKSTQDELTQECRRRAFLFNTNQDQCLSFPESEVEKKRAELTQRRIHNRDQARLKRTMFSLSFGIFFILVPLALLYLALFVIIKMVITVKIVK